MTHKLRILGIDPGSRITGFGVVDFDRDRAAYVGSGTVDSRKGEFADRLKTIFDSISEVCAHYRPDAVSVENVFVHKSAGSALKLGHARAAAICATFEHGIAVYEYAPRAIKQAIVGTGGAQKEQVEHMVKTILALSGELSADASDALAAALCHGHNRRLGEQLARPGHAVKFR